MVRYAAWIGLFGLTGALWSPTSAVACLWDRDTLRAEARGLPGIAEIITGRFERFPPLYYEMRLERVTRLLASDADDLEAYDDAAVACDRLGRGEQGVAWLERKKAALDRLTRGGASTGDHLYRYHANLGTLLAHQWLRAGGDRTDMSAMIAGREHIATAIRINPDAHFGREKYQLMAMDWIIAPPKLDEPTEMSSIFDIEGIAGSGRTLARTHADAVTGLAGLIVLGNAWESVDVFFALGVALQDHRHAAMADLARLRFEELIRQGSGSLHPQLPRGDSLIKLMGDIGEQSLAREGIPAYFAAARAEADQWQEQRLAYMSERLREGRHPDTDPTFWKDYRETPAPLPPNGVFGLAGESLGMVQLAGIVVATLGASAAVLVVVRRRRRGLTEAS